MALGRLFLIVISVFFATVSVQAQEGTAGLNVLESSQLNAERSPWGASFFSIGSLTQQQLETGGSSFSAYNYVGLNYKFSSSQRFAIRPVFYYNTAGLDKGGRYVESDSSLGDLHLVYSNYEIASLGDAGVAMSFKVYLPTSEFSQSSKMIAKVRPETIVSWDIGRFSSLSYVAKPDFFIQSNTTFVDAFAPKNTDGSYKKDPRRSTQFAALEHYLELDANVSKYLSIKPAVGFIEDWYNSGGAENLDSNHNTSAKLALGFDIRPMRRLSFTLGAENKVRLNNRRDNVVFLRPEDSGLFLMTNASM